MTGIYFTGGLPADIRDSFKPDYEDTPVLAAIRERFENDEMAISGSSAGLCI